MSKEDLDKIRENARKLAEKVREDTAPLREQAKKTVRRVRRQHGLDQPKTFRELYEAIRVSPRTPGDVAVQFDLDDDEVDAIVQRLRVAKIVQAIDGVFSGGRRYEVTEAARDDEKARDLAAAAGLDFDSLLF